MAKDSIKSPEWKDHLTDSVDHEIAAPLLAEGGGTEEADSKAQSRNLAISFLAMVVIGLGNKVFQKLQTIPMRNYPNFLNLLTTFVYIPLSFAYIIPMIKYGKQITPDQLEVPKSKFAVMGALDSLAGIMQVFAATYLPGSLLVLLSQFAIPSSMILSRVILKTTYKHYQYGGALLVAGGLALVLGPRLADSDDESKDEALWAAVMMLSCVPMCLSSIYKEIALAKTDLDAVYVNGWVAVFQFLLSVPLAIPAAMVGDPSVSPGDLPQNLIDGAKCYVGTDSITTGSNPDDCAQSSVYVTVYLLFNLSYNVLILLILKFGSANILWLAMTVMVPLANVAFSFDFVPDHSPIEWYDAVGLIIIMAGLVVYRYLDQIFDYFARRAERQRAASAGIQGTATSYERVES